MHLVYTAVLYKVREGVTLLLSIYKSTRREADRMRYVTAKRRYQAEHSAAQRPMPLSGVGDYQEGE